MEQQLEQAIEILFPTAAHTHTIIFLHGRDSNAAEFKTDFLESETSNLKTFPDVFPGVKWVFPSAGLRYSERFDTKLSQWFDIWSVENPDERSDLQEEGIQESIDFVLNVIKSEMALIPADRILLAGISQGCAIAILALLKSGHKLAAFIGLSSWMTVPEPEEFVTDVCSKETPLFLSHSAGDSVVPAKNGEKLRDVLESIGMNVEWHLYSDDGHWVNEPQGVDDMVAFIRSSFTGC
jgi:lysophospholipase II